MLLRKDHHIIFKPSMLIQEDQYILPSRCFMDTKLLRHIILVLRNYYNWIKACRKIATIIYSIFTFFFRITTMSFNNNNNTLNLDALPVDVRNAVLAIVVNTNQDAVCRCKFCPVHNLSSTRVDKRLRLKPDDLLSPEDAERLMEPISAEVVNDHLMETANSTRIFERPEGNMSTKAYLLRMCQEYLSVSTGYCDKSEEALVMEAEHRYHATYYMAQQFCQQFINHDPTLRWSHLSLSKQKDFAARFELALKISVLHGFSHSTGVPILGQPLTYSVLPSETKIGIKQKNKKKSTSSSPAVIVIEETEESSRSTTDGDSASFGFDSFLSSANVDEGNDSATINDGQEELDCSTFESALISSPVPEVQSQAAEPDTNNAGRKRRRTRK
ncbi:hypothetical protein BDF20DRAFT_856992 [Mycotypha africana]|uniref:uncharacterized protein n=1 Tax=Mycotypha africana TaxID=64632 RepID=UPI002301AEF2|nr:uncharacterized protein BDF20DRAFT_856992 [Mycotypha africana]KAI8983918.1 hypothetical protein BDF20DRAFT_856992 [Mycotypha africana]